MNQKNAEEDFSVVVTKEEVMAKNYSFSAGQYFEVKIEYVEITAEEFAQKMQTFESNLNQLFTEGNELDKKILENLKTLKF
jgi:type I restriction enzyme M protein